MVDFTSQDEMTDNFTVAMPPSGIAAASWALAAVMVPSVFIYDGEWLDGRCRRWTMEDEDGEAGGLPPNNCHV